MTSTLSEVEPSPVFVDESGRRGRRLRGLGWVFGVAFVGMTLAMVSGLLGTQSDAPSFTVPGSADTLPPGQYVDAPLPAPPGKADRSKGAPRTAAPGASGTPSGTPTATTSPTASATASSGAGDDPATATGTPGGSSGSGSGTKHTKPPATASSSAKPSNSAPAPTHTDPPTQAPPTQPAGDDPPPAPPQSAP